jgi:hypothetical protein
MMTVALAWWLLSASGASNSNLDQAKADFKSLDFENCLSQLQQARSAKVSGPADSRDIELYSALCNFSLGKTPEAKQLFKSALKIDPKTELPSHISPKAVELFNEVKKSLPPPTAEPPAFEETDFPTEKKKAAEPTRTVSDIPQREEGREAEARPKSEDRGLAAPRLEVTSKSNASFFERHPLTTPSLILGAVSVTSALVGLVLGLTATDVQNTANAAAFDTEFARLRRDAIGLSTGANIAYGVAATTLVAAVVVWWFFPPQQKAEP